MNTNPLEMERDAMSYDVVIVGAGPAGLSAAIRLKQLAVQQNREISVCVLEKGSEVGAHIMSGAVIDPVTLSELLPDWRELGAPLSCEVREDQVWFLTEQQSLTMPITPPSFQNHGNHIISLGVFCKWLAEQAENLGVEIYAGFAASEVLYHTDGSVKGVATGNMGVDKNGKPTDSFQAGMELHAQQTIFAEGARGSLTKQVIHQFALDRACQPQTYGLGIKEVWEVSPEQCQQGLCVHTVGWPLDMKTYGGGAIYHGENNQITVIFVVGLDYQNPYLSPFEEMQRFKTHPDVRKMLEGGRRVAYGARALVEGGLQSLPELSFAGGVLVGDAAGFLNVPRIKGIHAAMKSAMLAAEAVFPLLVTEMLPENAKTAHTYQDLFQQSWLYRELHEVRNVRPAFKWGLLPAIAYTALEQYVFKGHTPWTFKHSHADCNGLKKAHDSQPIEYPKPDGVLTFDRLSSVYLTNIAHEENQPVHLQLKQPELAIDINYSQYASPESRYCPAAVYEIVRDEETQQPHLHINAANCVHCKTCDIKDPTQNINWVCPEGGSGPNYGAM